MRRRLADSHLCHSLHCHGAVVKAHAIGLTAPPVVHVAGKLVEGSLLGDQPETALPIEEEVY